MVKAALTGGIATGKSYCLSRFAHLGASVIDADLVARAAVAPGTPGIHRVIERFGSGVQLPDGSLNRPALGRIVFADARARADLEAIIHPVVHDEITRWLTALPPETRVAIADIPLFFETGRRYAVDRVIVCACDPAEQLRRLMMRNALSEADARARIHAQMSIEEKIARADFVVRTDGTFADTDRAVDAVYQALLSLS
jgi:dephospho-CoA kinase